MTISMVPSSKYFQEIVEFSMNVESYEKHGGVKLEEKKDQTSGQFNGTFFKRHGFSKPYNFSMPMSAKGPFVASYHPS